MEKTDLFLGCLLGGAVGDALGYPVEFLWEDSIWAEYGPQGIQTLDQAGSPARVSDDTQMTLFTANGLLWSLTNPGTELSDGIWLSYREWLATQGSSRRMDDPENPKMWIFGEKRLHARRAPGNTCLSAIYASDGGTVHNSVNNSKGCGGVMRVAPIGLGLGSAHKRGLSAWVGAQAAALTHGHPMGFLPAAMLAQLVHDLVHHRTGQDEYPLQWYFLKAAREVTAQFSQAQELLEQTQRVIAMAEDPTLSDLDGIHTLGEGWVGDEALYIAMFCALRHCRDFAAAIRCAVNHKGDSDSTGAICGNILGAWLGREAVEAAFDLGCLEMRELIEAVGRDLYQAAEQGIPLDDPAWSKKYRR